jgi:ABC-2 type transport system permease protein
MLSLLKIEWMKIKSYKAFQVFSILYGVALLVTTYLCFLFFEKFTAGFKGNPIGDAIVDTYNPFKFPSLWANAGFFLSMLIYFPCIIIITFCVNEFTFKTHRQNIIDGWSRQQFLTSKLLLILAFSVVITLLFVISVWIFSLFAKIDFSLNGAEGIGYFFVQTFYYLLVAFMCAILFRKSGVAIIVFLLYAIVIESILLGVLNNYLLPSGYFLPLQTADLLTPLNIIDEDKDGKKVMKSIYSKSPQIYYMLAATFAYIGLFIFLSYKKFVKDDL